MSLLSVFSNWQSHLLHLILTVFINILYQPSFHIYNQNGEYILSEIILSVLWLLSFSFILFKGFIILHDCGHNAFFTDNDKNELLGKILSVFCVTPFNFWKKAHNRHHAIQGRTDKYDFSASIHFTVNDVKNMKNKYLRLLYLIYRIPLIFYITSPILVWTVWFPFFCLIQCDYLPLFGWILRPFIMYLFGTNGFFFYLKLSLIPTYIAAFLGVFLFHIQHSHNPPYRRSKQEFNKIDAAIDGSYGHKLPFLLKIFSMGIEYHAHHHFDTGIPGYELEHYYHAIRQNRLQYKVKNQTKQFDHRLIQTQVINYKDIYHCLFNIVYDENSQLYITWTDCIKQIYFT